MAPVLETLGSNKEHIAAFTMCYSVLHCTGIGQQCNIVPLNQTQSQLKGDKQQVLPIGTTESEEVSVVSKLRLK